MSEPPTTSTPTPAPKPKPVLRPTLVLRDRTVLDDHDELKSAIIVGVIAEFAGFKYYSSY